MTNRKTKWRIAGLVSVLLAMGIMFMACPSGNDPNETDTIDAAAPYINVQPVSARYLVNSAAAPLTIGATVPDGGTVSYQWYSNAAKSTSGGTAISSATQANFTPPVTEAGTLYYYALATNTNDSVTGSKTAQSTSFIATIEVKEGVEKLTISNGGHAVYGFTLPSGLSYGDFTKITMEVMMDADNFTKNTRARLYGNYADSLFGDYQDSKIIPLNDSTNAVCIMNNQFGATWGTATAIFGAANPNEWFTIEFALSDHEHQSFAAANRPGASDTGPFYFGLGPTAQNGAYTITYYVKNVALSNADGSKKAPSGGNLFDGKPAFLAYQDDHRNTLAREIALDPGDPPLSTAEIVVDNTVTYQKVTGFGGMSAVWTSPDMTVEDIDTMFSPDGLGYNILRVCVYPYMDDLFNGVEPAANVPASQANPNSHQDYYEIVKRAKQYGALILASPWTPPAEWKSNNSRNGGGSVLPEHYQDFADHLKNYIQRMEDNGAGIDYITMQNEADIAVSYDGCEWTPEETLAFVKQYARYIAPVGGKVKFAPCESYQFRRALYDPILNDPDAVNKIDIIAGHVYGGGLARYDLAINKGKEVWMTEHLFNTASNYAIDSTWDMVWAPAKEVHDCMTADFNAYVWWYSKRFYSLIGDDEYNTQWGKPLPRGYMLSHYAKYATGKTRIKADIDGDAPGVYVTAYESDTDISLVMFNMGTMDMNGLGISLPRAVTVGSGVISSASAGNMVPVTVTLNTNKKSAVIDLPAKSLMSFKFSK